MKRKIMDRIVIVVEKGTIQAIYTDKKKEFIVIDYDEKENDVMYDVSGLPMIPYIEDEMKRLESEKK